MMMRCFDRAEGLKREAAQNPEKSNRQSRLNWRAAGKPKRTPPYQLGAVEFVSFSIGQVNDRGGD
jgi:hypothetical protein